MCNLGCSKNLVDGQSLLGRFAAKGYIVVDDFSRAEVIIVNTCAFIAEATREAIDTILEMASFKKTGRCTTLIVSGCFSERYRAKAARELPEVDHWIGVKAPEEDVERILGPLTARIPRRRLTESPATQYLKIAEGCSHACSFCTIPSIRGPFRSRPANELINEARWLYTQGTRECILVSQDTAFWGRDIGSSLERLLEQFLAKTAFPWIRMMYLHPRWVDKGLLRLVAREARLCPYFDIPLQHIADPLLVSMRRRPLSGGIRELIGTIRATVPDAAIRTSFIVGYPGESERHFRELVRFVEESRFDKVGVFPFSPEEGTAARGLRPGARQSTVMRRCEELMAVQREISAGILAARVGQTVDVMIDRVSDAPRLGFEGRTRWDAPEVDGTVYLAKSGRASTGTIVRARIVDSSDYDLIATREEGGEEGRISSKEVRGKK